MASVKIILWKHDQKKDGTFPLAIRITQNRKTRYVFTGKYILEKEWDATLSKVRKSHANSRRLNNFLKKKLSEADDIALEAETNKKNNTSKAIQKKVKGKTGNVSFFQFGLMRVQSKYEAGTYSVAKSEYSILHNIREFLNHNKSKDKQDVIDEIMQRRKERIGKSRKAGYNFLEEIKSQFSKDKSLYFEDIDEPFLKRFKIFCSAYLDQKTRTITNQLIFIRTMYNSAIKEFVVEAKHYPFAGEKEKIKVGHGHKIGLTKEEVTRIENLKLEPETTIWHTRNIWLFAFYFAGIRISDVLEMKWSDFKDDRLLYVMNKNEKPVSLKIPDKAKEIIECYRGDRQNKKDYVFPYLKKADQKSPRDIFVKTRNATTLLNKYLKQIAGQCEIEKNLSNHIARHTFGNIAGDKIHPRKLQKLYRHSHLTTTIGYQANFIHEEVDDALDDVINF
ncbi:tyrosine-type recombinase/integrase [Aquimarina macrocephali]|uniref:tyrosine-type recombinase/integrase n=1 Tax=Aquimarina macrocephali TaxID=666563 RepID=UPI000463ECAF|nr:tyrosine-type recombinase/integrase [Aquimarina macrocephali]